MTETALQYRIIVDGAGWIDRRASGRVVVEGRDAASFLHALVTNDVQALAPGHGVHAAYLTPQGRMIADLVIHRLGDALLLQAPDQEGGALAARLDQLIFAEDARVRDVSDETAELQVLGAGAAAAIERAWNLAVGDVTSLSVLSNVAASETTIARLEDLGPHRAFALFVPVASFGEAVERLTRAGAAALDEPFVEAVRIEAGRPRFGVDMTTETIPLEAGLLERAISTTKGCYVGQEVIVRVLHRGGGRIARRLVRLAFDQSRADPPAPGAPLFDHDREVGHVTSASVAPAGDRVVGLAYVRREDAEAGRRLDVRHAAGAWPVEIAGLAG